MSIMGIKDSGTKIVTRDLQLYLDAGQLRSYSGSGATWNDLSSNKIAATITGTTFNTSNGGALSLNGTSDFIDCGTSLSLQFNRTTGFTLSAWILTPTAAVWPNSSNYAVIWRGTTAGNFWTWALFITPSGLATTNGVAFSTNFNNTFEGIDNIIAANTWYHIAVTMVGASGNNVTVYTNGVNRGNPTGTFNNPPTNADIGTTQNVYIGRDVGSLGEWFSQRIAGVALYNRALTGAEISQNFNADRIRYGL
jgi:hypothetical protein